MDATPGLFCGPVAGSVHEDVVAAVDHPVEEGLGDDGAGEQRVPVNWNWLMFLIAYLPFQMGICGFGVSA